MSPAQRRAGTRRPEPPSVTATGAPATTEPPPGTASPVTATGVPTAATGAG